MITKQTLEEASWRFKPESRLDGEFLKQWSSSLRHAFKEGAKWQAKRMYSEEDMIAFAEFVAEHPDKNRNHKGEMLHAKSKYDGAERTIDLLEDFKKKYVKK